MLRGGSLGAAFLRIGGGLFGGRILRGATLGFRSSYGGASEFRDKADPSICLSEGVSRNGAPITPLVRLSSVAFSRLFKGSTGGHCATVLGGGRCLNERTIWEMSRVCIRVRFRRLPIRQGVAVIPLTGSDSGTECQRLKKAKTSSTAQHIL